jgi:ACT domain-containing protein
VEVNTVISRCLPLVYDAGDIVDVGYQVVVLGDGAGDLCDGHLLEDVGAANVVGISPLMATIEAESSSTMTMLVASSHEVMTQTPARSMNVPPV